MAELRDFIDPNRVFSDPGEFMERGMLQFLQILFSTFPGSREGSFQWAPDAESQEIVIEGRHTDNLTRIDTRPKIVVYRGAMQWENRGLGNMVGSKNLSIESRKYTDVNDGIININCFAREALESDKLSHICYASIKQFRSVLQKFGFLSIHSAQRGQRAMIKSDSRPELFVTPVMISVQVTSNWSNVVVDPVLLRQILIQYTLSYGGKS